MPEYRISIVVDGRDNATQPLRGVTGVLQRMAEVAGGVLGANLFTGIATGLQNMAGAAVQATANFQQMQVGLESLLAREMVQQSVVEGADWAAPTVKMSDALDQAIPKANALMKEIEGISVLSPYQMSTVQNTFRLAMAFGYTSDEATKYTKALLNVAAGTGASNEMLDRMAYNFAQIRMQGRVTSVDIRQLAMAGFDLVGVLRYAGREMGLNIKTHEDFNEAIASGKISWQQFTTLFEKYAQENFGGASERMSRTLVGLKSTFSDLFMITMPKVLGPAAEQFTGFANEILNGFLSIREGTTLEDWGKQIGKSFEWMPQAGKQIGEFFQKVVKVPQTLARVVKEMGASGGIKYLALTFFDRDTAGKIIDVVDGLTTGVRNGMTNLKTFWDTVSPQLGETWNQIVSLFTGNEGVDWEGIGAAIGGAFESATKWMADNGPAIAQTIEDVGNAISTGYQTASQWIIDNGPIISQAFQDIGAGMSGAFQTANQWWLDNGWKIGDGINSVVGGFVAFGDWVKNNKDTILSFLVGAAPVLLTFAGSLMAVKVAAGVSAALDGLSVSLLVLQGRLASIAVTAGPLALVAAALGLIVYGLQAYGSSILGADAANATFFQKVEVGFWGLLYNASQSVYMLGEIIKFKFNEFKTTVETKVQEITAQVTAKFEEIRSAISEKIETARQAVQTAVDGIKGAFEGITGAISGAIERLDAFLKALADAIIPDWVSGLFGGGGGAPGAGSKDKKRAGGGPVYANRGYLVGEQGAEYFFPGVTGAIIPNHLLNGVMGGGDNVQVTVYATVSNDVDVRDLALRVAEEIRYRRK